LRTCSKMASNDRPVDVSTLRFAAGCIHDARDAITEAQRQLQETYNDHTEAHRQFADLRTLASEEVKVEYNKQRKVGDPIA